MWRFVSQKMIQKNKVLYNIFWTLLIVFSCLIVCVLVEPWFDHDFDDHPERDILSDEYNKVVESASWHLKVIIAPFCEEMVFRFPLLLFVLKYGKSHKKVTYLLALVLALLFGLMHVFNCGLYALPSVVFTMSMHGFLYGILVIKTKNMLCPIVAHGAYNGIVLL